MLADVMQELETALASLAQNRVPEFIPDMEDAYTLPGMWHTKYGSDVQTAFHSTHKMYGLVDLMWTKGFATKLGPARVLEIMAGRGWLAKALSSHGTTIHATDGHKGYNMQEANTVFPIDIASAQNAIQTYAAESDVLLCSWPPYDEPDLHLALAYWPKEKPIYIIGEGQGGCTADDKFWESFVVEDWFTHPNLTGQHSRVYKGYWPEGAL